MPDKEATARIKINRLLEAAGCRFFADGSGPANIRQFTELATNPVPKYVKDDVALNPLAA